MDPRGWRYPSTSGGIFYPTAARSLRPARFRSPCPPRSPTRWCRQQLQRLSSTRLLIRARFRVLKLSKERPAWSGAAQSSIGEQKPGYARYPVSAHCSPRSCQPVSGCRSERSFSKEATETRRRAAAPPPSLLDSSRFRAIRLRTARLFTPSILAASWAST
jgi:hypothetical protein